MNKRSIYGWLASLLLTVSAQGATVVVDPGVPLTNYWSGGEWNTDGNFEGWTTAQISGASVAGGLLTGTASGSDPQVRLLGVTGGPDLELAFFDYLDVRLQVPAEIHAAAFRFITARRTRRASALRDRDPSPMFRRTARFTFTGFFSDRKCIGAAICRICGLTRWAPTRRVGQSFALDYVAARRFDRRHLLSVL